MSKWLQQHTPTPLRKLYRVGQRWQFQLRSLLSSSHRAASGTTTADLADASTRAANPFATHIPILIGLAYLYEVRRILEFGCGNYSTRLFLDRRIFPNLEQLLSYENEHDWHKKFAATLQNDERANLCYVHGSMASVVASVPFDEYQLVFIDDSGVIPERVKTIRQVLAHRSTQNIVIIHDFQTGDYYNATTNTQHRYVFDALNPYTGIVWWDAPISISSLGRINKLVAAHMNLLDLDDIEGWKRVFSRAT